MKEKSLGPLRMARGMGGRGSEGMQVSADWKEELSSKQSCSSADKLPGSPELLSLAVCRKKWRPPGAWGCATTLKQSVLTTEAELRVCSAFPEPSLWGLGGSAQEALTATSVSARCGTQRWGRSCRQRRLTQKQV